ncbi:unnamed protein product [Rhizopus stolonifer]
MLKFLSSCFSPQGFPIAYTVVVFGGETMDLEQTSFVLATYIKQGQHSRSGRALGFFGMFFFWTCEADKKCRACRPSKRTGRWTSSRRTAHYTFSQKRQLRFYNFEWICRF